MEGRVRERHQKTGEVVVILELYGSTTTRRIPCTRSVSHRRYLAYENSIGVTRGRSSKGIKNLEERNVGTQRKLPSMVQLTAEDLAIMIPENRDLSYHRLDN